MSIKYVSYFGAIAAGSVIAAIVSGSGTVRWGLLLAALAFAFVGGAYAAGAAGLLLKRRDGRQRWCGWLVLWPYFLLVRLSFWMYRMSARGAAYAEVAPGVWFGRRLTGAEGTAAPVRWTGVLDLAAEFPRINLDVAHYRSLPVLDGIRLRAHHLQQAIAWIDERQGDGPVLIHCALGHGRTGSVVLAWLLMRGHIRDVTEGIARLRALRPSFGINAEQATAVERFVASGGQQPTRLRRGAFGGARSLMPEARYVVTVDSGQIVCQIPTGLRESVAWKDLAAVIVETNDTGPLGCDVLWVLVGAEGRGGCVIPQGASGEVGLLEALQKLPGFDHDAVNRAMCCVENRKFVCWERGWGSRAERDAATLDPA